MIITCKQNDAANSQYVPFLLLWHPELHTASQPFGSDVLLETVLLLALLILPSDDFGFLSPVHAADEHFHIPSKKKK